MSSSPLSKPGPRAGPLKRPVPSAVGSRWPQALVQTRERLRLRSFALATWPSCRGPRQPTASELAVVPSTTPSALNSNAWPARPRRVLSRHNVGSKFLRAFYCVPSHADERAQHTRHASRGSGGAALTLETSAVFQTGPNQLLQGGALLRIESDTVLVHHGAPSLGGDPSQP